MDWDRRSNEINRILQFSHVEDIVQYKICDTLQPRWGFSNVIMDCEVLAVVSFKLCSCECYVKTRVQLL